jgi:hypothetical protein
VVSEKNDQWGDGWGWALYEAKDPKRNVATDYTTDCKTCHVPAKKDDRVYVRGIPGPGETHPAQMKLRGVVHPGPGWSGYIEGCDHHDHPRFRWI